MFELIEHECCAAPKSFQTVGGKRPTIGAGIEGVLFNHALNYEPIEDSYLYLRIKDCNKTYYNPVTGKTVVPNYISLLTEDKFSDFIPDWKHYAESVVKKADPVFNAMGWDTLQIMRDVNQRSLDEWF